VLAFNFSYFSFVPEIGEGIMMKGTSSPHGICSWRLRGKTSMWGDGKGSKDDDSPMAGVAWRRLLLGCLYDESNKQGTDSSNSLTDKYNRNYRMLYPSLLAGYAWIVGLYGRRPMSVG
jgi:hypothetical protein